MGSNKKIGGVWLYACIRSDVAKSKWFTVILNICPRATPNCVLKRFTELIVNKLLVVLLW